MIISYLNSQAGGKFETILREDENYYSTKLCCIVKICSWIQLIKYKPLKFILVYMKNAYFNIKEKKNSFNGIWSFSF